MKIIIAILVVITITAFGVSRSKLLSQNQSSLRRTQASDKVTGPASRSIVPPSERETRNIQVASVRLKDIQRITDFDGFTSPVWSPIDPKQLAFVGSDGTYVKSMSGGSVAKISGERARFKYIWTKDGDHLVFRERIDEQQLAIKALAIHTGEVNVLAQSSDLSLPQEMRPGILQYRDSNLHKRVGVAESTPTSTNEAPFAYQFNDNIFVSTADGTKQITTDAGKYFLPQLSPDGAKVLYQEISRGLYVTDLLVGTTTYLGNGDDAVWSPDSTCVVFELTRDEDDKVVGSDLYLADLHGRRTQLTDTTDRLEMRPAWSSDGKYIAFDADGAIYIATIMEGE